MRGKEERRGHGHAWGVVVVFYNILFNQFTRPGSACMAGTITGVGIVGRCVCVCVVLFLFVCWLHVKNILACDRKFAFQSAAGNII